MQNNEVATPLDLLLLHPRMHQQLETILMAR
jgi:hypothetical protein